ncbi:MAG: glycosyl hydrolase, partial [Alistipes sp.]|nr:glycosyl hydrolase [Alistipes sp.]
LYPALYEGMTLQPFYRLYACRYMVYWPLRSADELATFQAELTAKEASAGALQQATTDVVYCGEQQPESDHFIASTDALTGDDEGRHWRRTRTSFSYQMATDNGLARHLRIAYRAEFLFDATVRINGEKVATLVDTDEGRDAVAMISIPQSLHHLDRLTISIERAGHHTTPAIYEVRLVR